MGEGGNKQPDAPLEVRSRDGQRFSLSSCVTVRESTETLGALNGMACSPPLEVKTKTMMDIETQEKTSVCEVSCLIISFHKVLKFFFVNLSCHCRAAIGLLSGRIAITYPPQIAGV